MDKKKFLEAVEEILNIENGVLNENSILNAYEDWDSMAFLEITVLINKEFNIEIDPSKIKNISSVKDLLELCKL
ncbi:acyl carrier protein [Campylobacter lari]|uniref:acyl carrier protein n=1 Tax=Campylobacter lari TaxID=201 RepID=UPI0013C7B6A5|nr:acyl carrier protein [Campylobacter lari]